jgi:CRISPR-associated protein Cmr6
MPSTALEHIFGAPRPGVQGTAAQGSVMFYDALPGADGVTIAEHVLTPHARDYHTGHGTQDQRPPPAEYLNPVPIPFLAIEKGTFVVHLLALQADTNEVADLVTAAVGDIGVGAKTAAGYGYLIAAPSGIRQRSAQQQEQSR